MSPASDQSPVSELHFETRDLLFEQLCLTVVDQLNQAIRQRGSASLIVSGGSTPKPLFALLAQSELDWAKVTVTLADERWVDEDDPASNAKLVRENLLVGHAAAASFLSLKTPESTPEQGEKTLSDRLAVLVEPLDVVLLGMGGDGHTASLFPKGDQLARALSGTGGTRCCAMRAPGAAQPRMTLSAPFLLHARQVVILCTGEDKRRVFEEARAGGPVEDLPIRAFLQQTPTPVAFYWAP
ncbi:6-phosphogluconolactonase [Acanthopleuribacter pedis]|uniref:6-phosphogluconolactonase n=1 Tax=Acanthopleuribacter pedis TaxID=442870 RepID=A0A8J7QDD0_9BACT|nr:6-phosphogluconolactonase [Acanthopleuribacter pedis]MBO1317525.1 6-phosphogluconolactonase [Acanthopleuribacter pedis]